MKKTVDAVSPCGMMANHGWRRWLPLVPRQRLPVWRGVLVVFSLVVGHGPAALAQTDEGRARQAALAAQVVERPTDLDLMFAYAVAAMQNQDYEPAIATFERMLIFNPNLPRVRLELGVAYYRLGVYEVARFYFDSVMENDPPEEVVARVSAFLTEIDRRTARNAFNGFIALGPVFSTNANLGPPDRKLRSEFFPGGVALIDADKVARSDTGFQIVASATHRYDLRGPDDSAWISTAAFTGRRWRDERDGNIDALQLSTGPLLALDDEAFGLKMRPYLSGSVVRSADDLLYTEIGIGAEVTQTVDPKLALFGVASLDWREFEDDRKAFDGAYGGAFAGVVYTPDTDLEYRAALLGRVDFAREPYTTSAELGIRLSATRLVSLRDAFGTGHFELPWRASLFAQLSYRGFDGADPSVDADKTRSDVDGRVGARLVAPLTVRDAIAIDAGYFERFSNIRNYDFSSFDVGLSYIRLF